MKMDERGEGDRGEETGAECAYSSTERLQWRRNGGLAGCVPHYLIHKSGPAFGLADFPFSVDSPVSCLATPRARYFSVLCCACLRFVPLLKRR